MNIPRLLMCLWIAIVAVFVQAAAVQGQNLNWSTDVGAVGVAGDSSYDTTTAAYHIKGAGAGLAGTADAFHFAYYQIVQGDGQIVVRLSSADALAQAALVVRQSLDPDASSAAVTVLNGSAQFVRRLATGISTVAGGATNVSVPYWLKLVRSGSTVSAFVSADGQAWASLGSDTVSLGTSPIYAGLAVSNGVANATSTVMASFDSIQSTFLPSDGVLLWLKADAGVTQSASGAVSTWADQSGNSNDAFQNTASAQPLAVANVIGNEPVIRFDGSSSYLQLPAGFSDFTQGLTAFVVTRPGSTAAWQRFFDIGNGAASDNLLLARNGSSNDLIYDVFDGVSLGTTLDGPGVLTLNTCQLLEVVQGTSGTVTMYNNAIQVAQGGASPINNITRSSGFIGMSNWSDSLFQGDIAEIVLFSQALSNADRQAWESYLNTKYQYSPQPTIPANLIAVPISTTQVTLSWGGTNGASTTYNVQRQNTDGSWTTVATTQAGITGYIDNGLSASSQYSYQIIANNPGGSSAPSVTCTATTLGSGPDLPTATLGLWIRADQGVTQDSNGLVSAWADFSGCGNTVSQQATGSQPQWVGSVINGQPVVRFDGVQDCLSAAAPVIPLTGGGTILAMVRLPDTNSHGPFVKIGYSNGVGLGVGSGTIDYGGDNAVGLYDNVRWIGTGQPLGVGPVLTEMTVNPDGSASFSRNGVNLGSYGGGGPILPTGTTGIGGYSFYSRYFRGDIAEVLVFNQPISDSDRQVWENYLNAKYQYSPPPPTPASFAVTAVSPTEVALSWSGGSNGETDYLIERQTANGTWSALANIGGETTSYVDSGLTPGTQYSYRITASGVGGSSAATAAEDTSTPSSSSGPPSANLQFWLRADMGLGQDSGGSVNSWADLSGNGYTAAQPTVPDEPAVVGADINGLPAVRFNGSTDFLHSDFVGMGGQELTFFVVTNGPQYQSLLRFQPAGSGSYLVYPWSGSFLFIDSADGATGGGVPSGLVPNQWNIGEATYQSGGQMTTYVNGVEVATRAAANVDLPGGLPLDIGYVAGGTEYAQADVAEVLIYNQALTDVERAAVETYLNSKYAIFIPPTPPSAPTSLVATSISSTQTSLLWGVAGTGGAAQSFSVERSTAGGAFVQVGSVLGAQTASFIDNNLVAGTSYTYQVKALNAAGNSDYSPQASATTPASVATLPATSNLTLWLKPDAGVVMDANGLVSSWTDLSGTGNNAAQPNSSSQPQWIDQVVNGLPVVRFNGVEDSLSTAKPAVGSNPNGTVLTVVRIPDTNTQGPFIKNGFYGGFALGVGGGTLDNTGNNAIGLYDEVRWLSTGQAWGVGPVLAEMSIDANGAPTIYRNGTTILNFGGGGPAALNGGTFIGGYQNDTARYFRGDVAEVLMFNRALTDAERQAWEGYLDAKYQYQYVPPPVSPSQLQVIPLSATQLEISWTEPNLGATSYIVERQNADQSWSIIATLGAGATSYIDSNLAPGSQYTYRVTGTNSGGSSPASGNNSGTTSASVGAAFPTDSIQLWLQANTGVTANASGAVSLWIDQSGNDNSATAPVASMPQLVTNTLNGQPIIRFDGNSSYLQLPSGFSDFTQGITAYVVAMPASASSYARFFDLGNGGGDEDIVFARYSTTNGMQFFYPIPPYELDTTGGLELNQYQLLECTQTSGTKAAAIYKNGVALSNGGSLLAIDNVTRTSNFIGRSNYGDPLFQGDMAEVLIFNRALTESERGAVESYLNTKYAIVSDPSAPFGVSASAISASQANLFWNLSPSATGYSVERKNAGASDDEYAVTAAVAGGQVQAYVDNGLTPGASYTYRIRAYNLAGFSGYSDTANVTEPAFGQSSLPADNLLLWLKPDAGVTQDANGFVSAWVDSSGNGNDAYGTSGSEPTIVADALNGQPVIRFDGSSSYLQLPSGFSDFTEGITALVVTRPASTTSYSRFFDIGNGAAQQNILFARYSTSNGMEFYSQNIQFELDTSSGLTLNQCELVEATQDPVAQEATILQNGIALRSVPAGNIIKTTRNSNFIGRSNWGDPLFNGDIAEVLIFNKALSDSDRQAWEVYLNSKYLFNPPPSAPTHLIVTPLSGSQVQLSWNENFQNVTGYTVERQNADGTWSVIATLGSGVTSYIDSGLTAGTQYAYQVLASNSVGTSPASASVSGTPTANGGMVFPTEGIQLWLQANSGVTADASGAVSAWNDTSGNGDGTAAVASAPSQPALIANGINNLPMVHFDGSRFLQLPDNLLYGLGAAEVFTVLRSTNPVADPSNCGLWKFNGRQQAYGGFYTDAAGAIYDTFGTNGNYGPITSPIPLDQFNIYNVSAAPNAWTSRINGQILYSNQTNVTDFSPGGIYLGESAWGTPFIGDIAEVLIFDHALNAADRGAVQTYLASKYNLASAPSAPTALTAYALSPDQMDLAWVCTPDNTATQFSIEREISGSNNYQVIASVNDVTSFIDTSATGGVAYSYRVAAVSLAGTASPYSNDAQATTPTSGVDIPLASLRLWLVAGSGLSGGVSDWTDQSGLGNDAQQTVGSNQPQAVENTFAVNTIRPVVHFDGSRFLQLPDDMTNGMAAGDAYIVLRASDPLVSSATRGLWKVDALQGYGSGAFYPDASGNIYETFGTLHRYGPVTSGAPLDQFNLYNVSAATNAWTSRMNGQILSTSQTNTLDFTAGTNLLGESGEGVPFIGDIAEVLIFDHVLSDDERQAVERYCTLKYALAGFVGGPPDADNDGDGISNYQEFLDGTNPNDYYNGQLPQIAISAGNNQLASAGAFVAQPLSVLVTSAAGVPLSNAPVVFSITRATGLLADPAAPTNVSSSVTVRTGMNGIASVLFQAPSGTPIFTSLVTASAGTTPLVSQVVFAEAIVATDDTSGDGISDGWKLEYGLNIATNDAAGVPESGGLTYLQDYDLGINPNAPQITSDGVPYTWMVAHGLDPVYDSDTAVDPNGSGLTYLQEYQLQVSTIDMWKFDEGGQSLTTTSSAGYNDVGTLVNNPVWTADPDGGMALSFAQTGAQVDVASPADGHLDFGGQQSFSVTARFQTSATGLGRLAGKGAEAVSAAPGYFLGINNGQLTAGIGNSDGQTSALRFSTNATYNDGQWHHVAATFDRSGQQACLYIDGILQAVSVAPGSVGVSQGTSVDLSAATGLSASRPTAMFAVGAVDLSGTRSFVGTMDNVGLFSKALTAAEVKALAGNQLDTPPVVLIDSPLSGAEFPQMGDIALDAQAYSPKGTINKVAFFSGVTELGEVDSFPYTFNWSQVPLGTYTITALAVDNHGASSASIPINVVVSADSNNNGLPDDWELQYFGNLNQTASGSYLNDGITNLMAYLLGLDPTKPVTQDNGTQTGLIIFTPFH